MPQLILCQTFTKGLINLAYIRQVDFRNFSSQNRLQYTCFITWSNGEKEIFVGKDAQAIAQTLKKVTKRI
ncbi:hypothetical protein CEN39_26630 [Fischerella thermalis CCMEE 5201]|jgi:hypothetical protein|nr:hypothetical protein CEN39_26630 [Fischerella thermalis CCMEE 5201]